MVALSLRSLVNTERLRSHMKMSCWYWALLSLCMLSILVAAASPEAFASSTAADGITMCRESPDLDSARRELAQLASQVSKAKRDADLGQIKAEFRKLLSSKCFALATENARTPDVLDTNDLVIFKAWWNNGGEEWLKSYVRSSATSGLSVIVPPDVLDTVAAIRSRSPAAVALSSLVCTTSEAACGAEAHGFSRRFELFFQEGHKAEALRSSSKRQKQENMPCSRGTEWGSYAEWRSCIEANRPLVPALPLGDTQVPHDGWLIFRDPADMKGCERIRAYDVGGGDAFVAENCPRREEHPIPVGRAGDVRTNRSGTVTVAMLREALWMLLLADQVQLRQVEAYSAPLPAALTPMWSKSDHPHSFERSIEPSATSEGTTSWQWTRNRGLTIRGTFCDGQCAPGDRYAADLVDVFESSFRSDSNVRPLPDALKRRLEIVRDGGAKGR